MRIVSIIISAGIGAYVMWELGSPLPSRPDPCLDRASCTGEIATAFVTPPPPPGFRIELYDPAIEPRLPADAEGRAPVRIVSAEVPWILDAGGPSPTPTRPMRFGLTGLGQPGAHGVCLAVGGGKRRCVAFIPAHDE